jgi:hypothetical protein
MKRLIGPNYPKTSCECSECPAIPQNQKWPGADRRDPYNRKTNNLGLRKCDQLDDIGQCISVSQVGRSKQPTPWVKKETIIPLNPNFGLEVMPGYFHPPDRECGDCPRGDCVVTAFDPRLISAPRGGFLQQLDRPPYTGEVLLKNIYEPELDGYGKNYKNYQTVNGGQIMYYIDPDLEKTYNLPVFTVRSNVDAEVFQTPMGGLWPQYPKKPFTKDSRYISPQEFTRMTVSHREDIMSKQYARYSRSQFPL